MLGSSQRPLPCEGSTIVCWRFLELAKCLQTCRFFALTHFPAFQEYYSGCCTVAAPNGAAKYTFVSRYRSPKTRAPELPISILSGDAESPSTTRSERHPFFS